MKQKNKRTPQTPPKKVFDVMRPGKKVAEATSRPVIVGHKPQVKDPMMSDRPDDRRLLDSTQKVQVTPTAEASEAPKAPVAELAQVDEKPKDGPYVADELAVLATSTTIDKIPEGVETTEQTVSQPPAQVPYPETAQVPQETPQATTSDANGTTGLIFDEAPDLDALTNPPKNMPATDAEPLPKLPEASGQPAEAHVVVSHHNYSNGWMKFISTFLILAAIAIVIIDVLLDSGLLVKHGLPHTNFFQ